MNKRKVISPPDERLRRIVASVTKDELASKAIKSLIDDLFFTMTLENAVGLAANQVGVEKQILVYRHPDLDEEGYFINPKIVWSSDELVTLPEGCLSLPDTLVQVKRPKAVRVESLDWNGDILIDEDDDMYARIWQHEIDHLNGILMIDRVPEEHVPLSWRAHRREL